MVFTYLTYASASGQHHSPLELIKQNLDSKIGSSLALVGESPNGWSAHEAEIGTKRDCLENVRAAPYAAIESDLDASFGDWRALAESI